MIALFQAYDEATRELLHSFDVAGIPVTPVVIEYDGDLPDDALCPFTLYTGIEQAGEPLFFNEVPVPAWCEIRQGKEPFAVILREGDVLGRIHYATNSFRQVESVDWLLPDRSPSHTDHYDRYGHRYATSYYSFGVVHQTIYRGPGEWTIEVNHTSKIVTMTSPGQWRTFSTLTDFVSFFLDDQGLATDRALINSLSYPLFVMRKRAAEPNTTLVWQEPMPADPPENMTSELERPVALERIVFVDERLRDKVAALYPGTAVELAYLSHLGQFADKTEYDPRRAFILTSSDEIPGLVGLLEAFPDVTFSVAALTVMSEKLHALGRRYANLTLTPQITHTAIGAELRQASVYLDINAGGHVLDVVKAAYYLDLVVFALPRQAKARDHERVFDTLDELAERLAVVVESEEGRREELTVLHTQRGPLSTAEDYWRLFG